MFKRITRFIPPILQAAVFPVFSITNEAPAVPHPGLAPDPPANGATLTPPQDPPVSPALTQAHARIAELEKTLAEAKANVGTLTDSQSKSQSEMSQLNGRLKAAVDSYKTLIIRANPEILPELLSGESIEALEGSLVKARELIGKVKSHLEARTRQTRIPAGAPPRGREINAGLTAREKIREGLGQG